MHSEGKSVTRVLLSAGPEDDPAFLNAQGSGPTLRTTPPIKGTSLTTSVDYPRDFEIDSFLLTLI